MAVRVVDASAVAALIFGESEAENVSDQLAGSELVAPSLLAFELANVCLMKCKRHPDQRAELIAGFQLRDRLHIEEIAVEHAEVLQLASETGLTAYDASYLWLARRLGADLVTLDRVLVRAAQSAIKG